MSSIESIAVGDVCHYCIGTDRYPCEVVSVTYFKSGTRKGLVSTVEVKRLETHRTDTMVFRPSKDRQAMVAHEHFYLRPGYSHYLDPSF